MIKINIAYSKNERSGRASWTCRSIRCAARWSSSMPYIGDVRAKAIIDTGGQTTIANIALQRCAGAQRLERREARLTRSMGATKDIQDGRIDGTRPRSNSARSKFATPA